jgi:hypothetical protein
LANDPAISQNRGTRLLKYKTVVPGEFKSWHSPITVKTNPINIILSALIRVLFSGEVDGTLNGGVLGFLNPIKLS